MQTIQKFKEQEDKWEGEKAKPKQEHEQEKHNTEHEK